MGSTVLTVWHKGEIAKIREWFHRIGDEIVVPRVPFHAGLAGFAPYNTGDSQILVEFKGNRMTMDCSIWDDLGKAYAVLVVQELAKSHRLKNAGWDSVGYCLDAFLRSEGLIICVYRNEPIFEETVRVMEEIATFLRNEAIELVK